MTKLTGNSNTGDCGASTQISCQQLDSFLVDYIDKKLSDEQRAAFERHIDLCAACVQYVEEYKAAISLGHEAFAKDSDECTEQVPDQLVKAILKASKR